MGTGLPASYTANGVVAAVPQLITSPAQAGALYGTGSVLHRLIIAAFAERMALSPCMRFRRPGNRRRCRVVTFTASTPTAGSFNLYVNGTAYNIVTATTDTPTTLSTKCQTAINADPTSPVIAARVLRTHPHREIEGPLWKLYFDSRRVSARRYAPLWCFRRRHRK